MSIKWNSEGFGVLEDKPNEKLILRYVHAGNQVIRASSVDLATGIFTASTPLPSAGTKLTALVSYDNFVPTQLFNEWNGNNSYGIEVINANTFYVINRSSSDARVTYANSAQNQGVNVLNLIFEHTFASPTIDISQLGLGDNFRATMGGIRDRNGWTSMYINGTHSTGVFMRGLNFVDGRSFMLFYGEQHWRYFREMGLWMERGGMQAQRTWNGGSSWSWSSSFDPARNLDIYKNVVYTHLTFQGMFANNTVIELYNW